MNKRMILILDQTQESKDAETFLSGKNVPFEILIASSIWKEIGYSFPTLLTGKKVYQGLEEIRKVPKDLHYGAPS